jgi:hypothetical protein
VRVGRDADRCDRSRAVVGDYERPAASGSTFDSAFVMAQPIATPGKTGLFFNTAP